MSTAASDISNAALPAGLEEVAVRRLRRDTCAGPGTWQLSGFSGRLIEISGNRASASLTLAFRLVHEAQRQGEPVAWISRRDSVFFPPAIVIFVAWTQPTHEYRIGSASSIQILDAWLLFMRESFVAGERLS